MSDWRHTVTRGLSLIPGGYLPSFTPCHQCERETRSRSVMSGERRKRSGWGVLFVGCMHWPFVGEKDQNPRDADSMENGSC